MMSKQFYKEELGKMIAENSNLKRKIQELELQIKFGTPTDGLEVGSPEDYDYPDCPQLNLFDE